MRLFALSTAFAATLFPADFKSQPLSIPPGSKTGFTLVAPSDTGVSFTNFLSDASAEKNRILENGSGVALGDVDGDGRCDIYLCGLESSNALFLNRGNWKFEAVADAAGAACAGQASTGAVFADVDCDGDLDLLVNGIAAGTQLFRNDGKGHFTEDSGAGLERRSGATSMALADVDGDGDLDLYVATYRSATIQDGPTPGFEVRQEGGKLIALPEEQFEMVNTPRGPNLLERGEPDFLYLNDGNGKFSAVSWTDGRFLDEDGKALNAPPRHWGLAVMFHDLNNDGAPDLYVCNDFLQSPDDVWINDGKGNFRRIDRLAIRHTSWSSMTVDVADINHDGFMDLFVADMFSPDNVRRQTQRANAELASIRHHLGQIDNRPQNFQNTLQLNRGDGTFAEISQLAGLQATDWTWSAIFLDVDLDGWEDLLVTTGHAHDIQDADITGRLAPSLSLPPHLRPHTLLQYPPLRTANRVFRNNHDLTFSDRSDDWGFNEVGVSNGMALGDLDGDGDLDVVVNNLNGAAALYRNDSSAPRVVVRLRGNSIGGRIEVQSDGLLQTQEMICGGRYLSGDENLRTFAAPSASTITIRWRNGGVSRLEKVAPNQLVEITEPVGSKEIAAPVKPALTWFKDASQQLGHHHKESPFDDWALQPLLPNRLGNFGPGVCALDANGDGWDDILIGSSRGEPLALYLNDKGTFTKAAGNSWLAPGDVDGIVALPGKFKGQFAFSVSNLEIPPEAREPSVQFFKTIGNIVTEFGYLPAQTDSAGPLAVGDVDGDGTPELFIGTQFARGRYPESGPSRLARYSEGIWKVDRKLSAPFADAGMVTGAQFGDIDGDGDLDLVLSIDWGAPKVFRNDHGKFTDATAQFGLSEFTGRWNNLLLADFNGDGALDLLVAGWGRNTKFQRYLAHPLKVAYGDFNSDQHMELLESFFDPTLKKYVPWRGKLSLGRNIPGLDERLPSFVAFGSAGTDEMLEGKQYQTLEARTLDTMLFLNRKNRFEPAELPIEGQFAPVFGLSAADFDGDGNLDVFLAQNFFALHDETTRMDAGRGLILQGDGRGGFRAVPGQVSGVLVYGEQRGCAVGDFNHDGKPDIVVTQNGGDTKLFLNQGAGR